MVLRVGGWIRGFGEGDFVAIGIFGHLAWVGDAVWVWWLRELIQLNLALVHMWTRRSRSIAMRKNAGFLAHV